MASDIYIGYDIQDEKIAEDICEFLENNNKTCWIKKRDFNEEEDTVYKITEAIKSSRCFVLIYSKDSNDSNHVITDLDIAFGSNIPIIVFKVDDSVIAEKQEFYLKEKPLINAYPNILDYYGQLDENISNLITSSSSESSLPNEAYVCCCEEDVLAGEAICHVLEENGIKCWLKKRDFLVNDSSEKIIESIENSKCFILVHSKDAINSSNVITEINYAISNNIPILSFKIEESDNLDNLENAHWLDAYPNPEEKFNDLVIDTGNLIGKQVSNPKITEKYNIGKKESKKSVETKIDKSSKEFTKNYGIGKHFKKIVIVVIIIALIGIAAVYFSTNGLTFLGDDGQIVKDSKGIHYEEKLPANTLDMVTTKIRLDDKHCKVWAKLYTEPDNFDQYNVHAKYFDSSNQVISESDTLMKDIEEDGDRLLIVDYNSDKVVHSVEITISDENGNQVFYVHNEPN